MQKPSKVKGKGGGILSVIIKIQNKCMEMDMSEIGAVMPLMVGDSVPEATAFQVFHKGEIQDTNIAAFRGKWLVLFFYPGDFTFVCPTELGELAGMYDAFQKEGVEIVSMSTDTVFSHKVWHETSPVIKEVTFQWGLTIGTHWWICSACIVKKTAWHIEHPSSLTQAG